MLAGCHCKLRAKELAVFSISYIGNQLAVSFNLEGSDNWQLCFYLHDVLLPTGIVSITAFFQETFKICTF